MTSIDLPIQREAGTELPVIWGQSLKGAIRHAARDAGWEDRHRTEIFGSPPPGSDSDGGDQEPGHGVGERDLIKGGTSFGDAQLVAFPAAALRNCFAWATSPLLLSRLTRKTHLVGVSSSNALDDTIDLAVGDGLAAQPWAGRHVLGPLLVNLAPAPQIAMLGDALAEVVCPNTDVFAYTRSKMSQDTIVLPDTDLTELTRHGTDVVARVQLDDHKSVAEGPFFSEHLPPETVLAAILAGPAPQLDRLHTLLDGATLQLGGDETIGKGLLWCRLHGAATLSAAFAAQATHAHTELPSGPAGPAVAPVNPPPAAPDARPHPEARRFEVPATRSASQRRFLR